MAFIVAGLFLWFLLTVYLYSEWDREKIRRESAELNERRWRKYADLKHWQIVGIQQDIEKFEPGFCGPGNIPIARVLAILEKRQAETDQQLGSIFRDE